MVFVQDDTLLWCGKRFVDRIEAHDAQQQQQQQQQHTARKSTAAVQSLWLRQPQGAGAMAIRDRQGGVLSSFSAATRAAARP